MSANEGVRWANGKWQARFQVRGKPHSFVLSLPNTEEGRAEAVRVRSERMEAAKKNCRWVPNMPPAEFPELAVEMTPERVSAILSGAKRRAAKRGITFALTKDDVAVLWRISGGRCVVTGMPFSLKYSVTGSTAPFAPSLDRISSAGGYTLDNCRLVTWFVNNALSDWPDLVLHEAFASWATRCGWGKKAA